MTPQKETFCATFFGQPTLERDGVVLDQQSLKSPQLVRLLMYLIYKRDVPAPISRIVDRLWPEEVDDPAHALSNLIYRLRKALARLWPGEELILYKNGTYQWNPEAAVELDCEQFDAAAQQAAAGGDRPEAMSIRARMLALYKGRFLEDFTDDLDILAVQNYYHNLYLREAAVLIRYYVTRNRYEELEVLCQDGLRIDSTEEIFHVGVMKAYIATSRFREANDYYEGTVKLLMERLGSAPGQELKELYIRMQQRIHVRQMDLDRILGDMAEQYEQQKAFYCAYGFFQKIYILEERHREREDYPITIVLISLYMEESAAQEAMDKAMEHLKEVLLDNLRHGDVITKFSPSQYLAMMSGLSMEQVEPVMQRINNRFYEYSGGCGRLEYSAHEMS